MRPRPKPPCFPYTTLFRSQALGQKAEEAARAAIGQFETMRLAAAAEGKRAVESVEAARVELEKKLQEVSTGSGESLRAATRSEEHTSELQSQSNLVCRLLL